MPFGVGAAELVAMEPTKRPELTGDSMSVIVSGAVSTVELTSTVREPWPTRSVSRSVICTWSEQLNPALLSVIAPLHGSPVQLIVAVFWRGTLRVPHAEASTNENVAFPPLATFRTPAPVAGLAEVGIEPRKTPEPAGVSLSVTSS